MRTLVSALVFVLVAGCVGVPPAQPLARASTFADLRWTMTGSGVVRRSGDTVTLTGGPGALVTSLEDGDYRVRVDVMVEAGGNSGVFVRGRDGLLFPDGVEIQINPVDVDNPTGSIYGRSRSRAPVPAAGEWFALEITARGARVESLVNGVAAAAIDDDEASARGPLFALQLHYPGSVVHYRGLVIEPLVTPPR